MITATTQVFNHLYIMKSGDTIYDVAMRYTINWRELALYNNIKDPNNIPIGTILDIPAGYIYTETPNWLRDKPLKSGW